MSCNTKSAKPKAQQIPPTIRKTKANAESKPRYSPAVINNKPSKKHKIGSLSGLVKNDRMTCLTG